jgi:hypothetical protein
LTIRPATAPKAAATSTAAAPATAPSAGTTAAVAPALSKREKAVNADLTTSIYNIIKLLKDKEVAVEMDTVLKELNLLASPNVKRIREAILENEKIDSEVCFAEWWLGCRRAETLWDEQHMHMNLHTYANKLLLAHA